MTKRNTILIENDNFILYIVHFDIYTGDENIFELRYRLTRSIYNIVSFFIKVAFALSLQLLPSFALV